MSGAGSVGGGSHRRNWRSPLLRRAFWLGLAVAFAVVSVAVPPLIVGPARHQTPPVGLRSPAGVEPTPSTSPMESASATTSAPASASQASSARAAPSGPRVGPAPTPARSPATLTLTAVSITTTAGFVGRGETVLALGVNDLSGRADDFVRYVEFSRGYVGYLSYPLPADVVPDAVTQLRVKVNYRGPAASFQRWTFLLYDWRLGRWVPVGSNELAPDWGNWSMLAFTASGEPSDYISSQRVIEVQLTSGPQDDTADIDYLVVALTWG